MKLTLASINCNERHYSLGVYILAAMVRRHLPDVCVRVCNYSIRQTSRHMLFDLLAEPADVFAFSVHHGHKPKILALIRDIRRLQPGVKILLGGIDAITVDRSEIEGLVDLCVIGEGEWALVEAMKALEAGQLPASTSPNLVRPEELAAGMPIPSAHSSHLDDFPSPYLDGIYREYEHYPAVYLETYRGCVWNCNFCYEGRGRRGTARYSEDRVFEELHYLLESRHVPQIEFYDTIFNVEPDRTKRLLEFLIRHRNGASFIGEFMLEWLDRETIDLIGRANFVMMETGLQSVREQTLRRSGRKVDLERYRTNAMAVLDRTNVNLCIDAMYGLEDEDLEDFKATVDHIGTIEGSNGRRPTPILFTTNIHPATRLYRKRSPEMQLEGDRGGTVLTSGSLSLRQTGQFYELFYGYLILRATFPKTMNELTGVLQRRTGLSLTEIYVRVARLLKEFPATRGIFEQVDWTEFRSNPFLRFFLNSIDPSYILMLLERLDNCAPEAFAEIETIIAREKGEASAMEQGDR